MLFDMCWHKDLNMGHPILKGDNQLPRPKKKTITIINKKEKIPHFHGKCILGCGFWQILGESDHYLTATSLHVFEVRITYWPWVQSSQDIVDLFCSTDGVNHSWNDKFRKIRLIQWLLYTDLFKVDKCSGLIMSSQLPIYRYV